MTTDCVHCGERMDDVIAGLVHMQPPFKIMHKLYNYSIQ